VTDRDARTRFFDPAEALERQAAANPDDLGVLIDLIVHYSMMLDPGIAAAAKLSAAAMAQAQTRREHVFVLAAARFAAAPRLEFWRRYLRWAELGEPFPEDDCRVLAAAEPTNPEPALYLFACCRDPLAESAARELLRRVQATESERASYIRAVLGSAFSSSA
jgi:hypothetical protein